MEVKCDYCEKIIQKAPSRVKKRNYCNRDHYHRDMREKSLNPKNMGF